VPGLLSEGCVIDFVGPCCPFALDLPPLSLRLSGHWRTNLNLLRRGGLVAVGCLPPTGTSGAPWPST
jgi:hypothetical protein